MNFLLGLTLLLVTLGLLDSVPADQGEGISEDTLKRELAEQTLPSSFVSSNYSFVQKYLQLTLKEVCFLLLILNF